MSVKAASASTAEALVVSGVAKRFEGIAALLDARLSVRAGEIHALLGENGAGKSTLIKILTGLVRPDAGIVELEGRAVDFHNVQVANAAGVVALYQELAIIPTLTVAENIALGGRAATRWGLVDWRSVERLASTQLDRLGQSMPLHRLAAGLSPVGQTMVALARGLAQQAKVLILDEPTAALTESEVSALFKVLRQLRAEGVSIIYVSHRLEEVFELCDRYTVMRNGTTVATGVIAEVGETEIIQAMVGRDLDVLFPPRVSEHGDTVLEVTALSGNRVAGATFTAHAGEILGIGGLAGSGRSELLRLIAAAQPRSAGGISVGGLPVQSYDVAGAIAAGIAYVPEERRTQGLDLASSIERNIEQANFTRVARGGLVSDRRSRELAVESIQVLAIRSTGPRQPAGQLSGGNQQKVVLAKALAGSPRVLLVDEPTRGIDVGARAEIYRLLRDLAQADTAVVIVSSDLVELIGLSDRILTVCNGRINGEFQGEGVDETELLAHFYGRTGSLEY